MDYDVFTAMLKNRAKIEKDIDRLKLKLEVLENAETGLKGINYSVTPISYNPSLSALKRLDLIEEIDDITREINVMLGIISETEIILQKMPEDLVEMLKDKYIRGLTFAKMGRKYGYSDAGMWLVLRRETEKYL